MSKTLVKIICQTRNEYDLLEDFILYHAYIFGYESIILLDHCSTNHYVRCLYEKYQQKGVIVEYERDREYHQQQQTTRIMLKYKSTAEFLIPLDTDEFLCLAGDEAQIELNPTKIIKAIQKLPVPCSVFYYNSFYISDTGINASRPATEITTFHNTTDYTKVFYRACWFIRNETGSHTGAVSGGMVYKPSGFIHIHFQHTGMKRYTQKTYDQFIGFHHFKPSMSKSQQFTILKKKLKTEPDHMSWHRTQLYLTTLLREHVLNVLVAEQIIPTASLITFLVSHPICNQSHMTFELVDKFIAKFLKINSSLPRDENPVVLTTTEKETLIYPNPPVRSDCVSIELVKNTLQAIETTFHDQLSYSLPLYTSNETMIEQPF